MIDYIIKNVRTLHMLIYEYLKKAGNNDRHILLFVILIITYCIYTFLNIAIFPLIIYRYVLLGKYKGILVLIAQRLIIGFNLIMTLHVVKLYKKYKSINVVLIKLCLKKHKVFNKTLIYLKKYKKKK